MSPIDDCRLIFELHSDALCRALGTGGSKFNLPVARRELAAVQAALEALAAAIGKGTTP